MKPYFWRGITVHGAEKQGIVHAENRQEAIFQLHQQAIIIRKLAPRHLFMRSRLKIASADLVWFSQQMATLLGAGISLLSALDTLIQSQPKHLALQQFFKIIKMDLSTGFTLSEALSKHPLVFSPLYCQWLQIGELTGRLEILFSHIARHQETRYRLKTQIKQALLYPLLVMGFGVFITTVLLLYVVPQFAHLFQQFNAQLPVATRLVIGLSHFLQQHGWWLLLLSLIIPVSCVYHYRRSLRWRLWIDRILLHLPLMGSLLEASLLTQFASSLAITYGAGIPIVTSLNAIIPTLWNRCYQQALYQIYTAVINGQSLHLAVQSTQCFPELFTQILAIGEQCGQLELMLEKIAIHYTGQLDTTFKNICRLLEPLIMAILGLFVGGLMIAMYLPIIQLGTLI